MDVDVVITGLNVENHIADCAASVRASRYRKGELRLWYVDLGSADSSVLMARRIPGLQVLHGPERGLSPCAGRNLGWRRGDAPLVLFLDARSRLSRHWVEAAVRSMEPGTGAVSGLPVPSKDCGFWSKALIWEDRPILETDDPLPANECIVRRKVLQLAHGLDQTLAPASMAGLGVWMVDKGWRTGLTRRISVRSQARKLEFSGFLRRCYRQGQAYAEIRLRRGFLRRKVPGQAGAQAASAVWRCGSAALLAAFGAAGLLLKRLDLALLLPMGAFIAIFPRIWRVGELCAERDLNFRNGENFAWARCAAGFPWAAGYLARVCSRPWRIFKASERPGGARRKADQESSKYT
ncbi:MAG: glycosyltransferase family 2 protein [Desulfovibrionaceae bacterium]